MNFLHTFYMVFILFLYTYYIHAIHIEGQDEGQKVATRKVEDCQKTLFSQKCLGTFAVSFAIIPGT